jgi:hypothetical protein
MSIKTNVELKAQIDADIKVNGNREITPPKHNSIETNIIDSHLNVKDGGNVIQVLTGYASELTPSDVKHFTPKKYVDDLIAAQTLQAAYTKSTAVEILTDSTRGAFSVKRGSAADTDNIIEGLNGAGTSTFGVNGNGRIIYGDTTIGGGANGANLIGFRGVSPGSSSSFGAYFLTGINDTVSSTDVGIYSYMVNYSTAKTKDKVVGFRSYINMHDVGGGTNTVTLGVGFESQMSTEWTNQHITNVVHFGVNAISGLGTTTNEYVLKLENSYLKGTNKWFLYNDDATVNSYLKGNVTIEGKIIASTGYAATKLLDYLHVQTSHTGDVLLTTKKTVTIPAGLMGANSTLRIYVLTSCTNNANAKNIIVDIGGTTFSNVTLTSVVGNSKEIKISNRNATNSQVVVQTTSVTGSGNATTSTGAIDFTTSQTLSLKVQLANSGDTISIEDFTVEVLNPGI